MRRPALHHRVAQPPPECREISDGGHRPHVPFEIGRTGTRLTVMVFAPAGKSPTLMIRALRDPDGANLDRVQASRAG